MDLPGTKRISSAGVVVTADISAVNAVRSSPRRSVKASTAQTDLETFLVIEAVHSAGMGATVTTVMEINSTTTSTKTETRTED